MRIRIVSGLMITAVLSLAGCGGQGGQAAVLITTPVEGVTAGDVTINVDVTDFDIAGKGNPEAGHIIYYIDTPVPVYYDHLAISGAGTYAVSDKLSHTWSGVTPGEHTFSAQLVKGDNTPLPSPVVNTVKLHVAPPKGDPKLSISLPKSGDSLTPGPVYIGVMTKNFILSGAHIGATNRTGEGHLIYYIDEEPPVDPGAPALTETSVVSVKTDHIWRDVKAGTHTLYVQLVNNDDTPLKTPVVASVTVEVAP